VDLYRPLLLYWCRLAGLQSPDAQDVVQEVLRSAFGKLNEFRHDRPGDTFRGWLRVITRHAIALHKRRKRNHQAAEGGSDALGRLLEVPDPVAGPDPGEEAEMGQVFRRALELVRGEFEGKTWQMFWRTVVENQSTETVAGDMEVTAAAVRQARSRVLRRLREELGEPLD
jgi:RNA polymerase sigma-70 factor (ECF subfamily)